MAAGWGNAGMVLDRMLERVLARLVSHGTLRVTTERDVTHIAGDGGAPRVHVRLLGRGATAALLRDPELTLGELYVDGGLLIEEGSLIDLLRLLVQDIGGDPSKLPLPLTARVRRLSYRFSHGNDPKTSKLNVAHHYDLSGALYDLFLDRYRQYSCAYFESEGLSLDEAQRAKQRHVAAKLAIEPGASVLDIGSGWGGLAVYLASVAGAGAVRGITLSDEQLAASRRAAADRGLADVVSFESADYRSVRGTFDRIVSVGMFEHVSPKDHAAFFEASARLLARDGVMLLHTIGRSGKPGYTNPWIRKYIFPGGHLPTLSEITAAVEPTGLIVSDVEVLRLHYAQTLAAWRARFTARRAEAAALFDERFCRIWEFYLAVSEAAFRWEGLVVFQVQLAKRNDALPITRAYMGEREEALRIAETEESGRAAAAA